MGVAAGTPERAALRPSPGWTAANWARLSRDRGGHLTGEHQYQGSVANKALELLGRHLGMFTDRIRFEDDLLDHLSPDELVALARHLREAGFGASGEGGSETRH